MRSAETPPTPVEDPRRIFLSNRRSENGCTTPSEPAQSRAASVVGAGRRRLRIVPAYVVSLSAIDDVAMTDSIKGSYVASQT
jgi:hypothetical protein